MKRVVPALFALVSLIPVAPAHAQAVLANFSRTSAGETVIAPHTSSSGTATLGSYSGLTEILVSGTGNAFGATVSDAFYYLDGNAVGQYYGLNLGYPGRPFAGGINNNIQNWMTFIEGSGNVSAGAIPAYRADHTYHFVLDLPNQTAGPLFFGVSDGAYNDNGGQYTVQVYSVVRGASAPEPSAFALLALPTLGIALNRRTRNCATR